MSTNTNVEQDGWKLIAGSYEGGPYEIDDIEIYQTPDGYFLRTASGCSCWDGEYDEYTFPNLEQVAVWMFGVDSQWHPSYKRSLELLKEVFQNNG